MDIATMSDKELRIFIKGYEEAINNLRYAVSFLRNKVKQYELTFDLLECESRNYPEKVAYDLLDIYNGRLKADLEELKKEASKRFETDS